MALFSEWESASPAPCSAPSWAYANSWVSDEFKSSIDLLAFNFQIIYTETVCCWKYAYIYVNVWPVSSGRISVCQNESSSYSFSKSHVVWFDYCTTTFVFSSLDIRRPEELSLLWPVEEKKKKKDKDVGEEVYDITCAPLPSSEQYI